MARICPERLRELVIDDARVLVPERASIGDVVPRDVVAITTLEPDGSSRLLTRREFAGPLPAGFTTHLTHVEKGGTAASPAQPIKALVSNCGPAFQPTAPPAGCKGI